MARGRAAAGEVVAAGRSFAHLADIEGPLVDWREKGHRVDYLGTIDNEIIP